MASEEKSRYESIVNDWLEPDGLMLLECWSRDGYTYQDIANKIGITKTSLQRWRKEYPEIEKAMRNGREIVDYKVENALLKSALGYRTKESKITLELDNKTGEMVTTKRETTTKEIAPSVPACTAWLCNRLPDKWKRNRDNIIELDDEESAIQVSVVRTDKKSLAEQPQQSNSNSDDDEDDWQDEVNESVSIKRNPDYYENKENKSKKKQSKHSSDAAADSDDSVKGASKESESIDYWPDDWEDD